MYLYSRVFSWPFKLIISDLDDIKFINISATKKLLMVNNFTFAPMGLKHFYCSKKAKGCKARIYLDKDRSQVTFADNEHNHLPPQYAVSSQGYYIKV